MSHGWQVIGSQQEAIHSLTQERERLYAQLERCHDGDTETISCRSTSLPSCTVCNDEEGNIPPNRLEAKLRASEEFRRKLRFIIEDADESDRIDSTPRQEEDASILYGYGKS